MLDLILTGETHSFVIDDSGGRGYLFTDILDCAGCEESISWMF
jgi:hypothetical protein